MNKNQNASADRFGYVAPQWWVVEHATGIVRAAQPSVILALRYATDGTYLTNHMPSCSKKNPCDLHTI